MNDNGNDQNVGANEFDYPNSQNPLPRHHIYYGDQRVPHPTNAKAKIVNHELVMREVLEGK